MSRVSSGDLLSIERSERFYYALILGGTRLLGGDWTYVFHRTSAKLLHPEEVLAGADDGFHAFVDFIWAKRENRLTRLASKVERRPFTRIQHLKGAHAGTGKATLWFIYDMGLKETKRTPKLSDSEKRYPDLSRIDDALMAHLVDRRWRPEHDARI